MFNSKSGGGAVGRDHRSLLFADHHGGFLEAGPGVGNVEADDVSHILHSRERLGVLFVGGRLRALFADGSIRQQLLSNGQGYGSRFDSHPGRLLASGVGADAATAREHGIEPGIDLHRVVGLNP